MRHRGIILTPPSTPSTRSDLSCSVICRRYRKIISLKTSRKTHMFCFVKMDQPCSNFLAAWHKELFRVLPQCRCTFSRLHQNECSLQRTAFCDWPFVRTRLFRERKNRNKVKLTKQHRFLMSFLEHRLEFLKYTNNSEKVRSLRKQKWTTKMFSCVVREYRIPEKKRIFLSKTQRFLSKKWAFLRNRLV